ncbi:CHAP domain-containing protein [Staphylococcus pseudoxylosus]|uniref:CHAP domain-containing protein n=1 Tax=Staphylococcus pseudoxylosus TaxID=2282419 RepID=UPI002DB81F67|nr:CHAP domain-containing protein [Staphylococcus pseudoxylosus]MEB6045791.1 LysM peptidoglycan-binding domain-containing protein [Staphylococcus pseudoxylosus]MEB8008668.1 LysM peptidoglycan-binding domain-containing protein [Staphylococcus pseudoxylosus]
MKKGLTFSITTAAMFFGINGIASADQIHTVKENAKLTDIAQAFATSTTEIQNLNQIHNRAYVQAGEKLVLPDNDIVEVKVGDSIQSIATAHQLTVEQLIQLNPNLGDVIYPGQLIAVSEKGSAHLNNQIQQMFNEQIEGQSNISDGNYNEAINEQSTPNRATTSTHMTSIAPQTWSNVNTQDVGQNNQQMHVDSNVGSNEHYSPVQQASNGNNYYTWGQCTYYAFDRRQQLGKSVGNLWGNANNWASAARQNGYQVNHTPEVGAIFQSNAGNYGHVGVVERKNSDGSILVSEMNWQGVGQKSYRTVHNTGQYNYIH